MRELKFRVRFNGEYYHGSNYTLFSLYWKYVIDTYQGWDKLPNIANFIQFDKKVKRFTHFEMLEATKEMSREGREKYFEQFTIIKENEITYWIKGG